ncbi:MAG: excinuclease ABC subunit UvrA [Candidatus Berkelbacteria bacterium]|nr:excinuclease ABC subunit UvrA [Candidatus Berkelbacteria bacterium]
MEQNYIFVKGAREHNLKNIDVKIPRNKLVVITGLSGSGKSSLAFDTIFAEGQRRYIESLSSYARQFLGQVEKPDVDYIEGLSPAVSIDQKAVSKNPRSTVGTVTEIYDYLRVLFARVGQAYCPIDGKKVQQYGVDEVSDLIVDEFKNKTIEIYAPIVRGRKGDYLAILNDYFHRGYETVLIDGKAYNLKKSKRLERYKTHNIEILIDRISIGADQSDKKVRTRLNEAIEISSKEAEGLVDIRSSNDSISFSTKFSCPDGHIFEELEPRLFSFNSPYGACEECLGLGYKQEVDPALIVPDETKTIEQGAVLPWSYSPFNYYGSIIRAAAKEVSAKTNIAYKNLSQSQRDYLIYGSDFEESLPVQYFAHGHSRSFFIKFNGIVGLLEKRFSNTDSDAIKEEISKYMSKMPCEKCRGKRLKENALSVKVANKSIDDIVSMSIQDAMSFFENINLNENDKMIASRLIKEIYSRLKFLVDVGLNYLTLDRYANSLSGGETQRIRLASQIGSGLVGVLYVLDEPSIGLHQRDNRRLLQTLKNLRDLGNSVIVIEHDEETMLEADYIVDVGPGAGIKGGEIVAEGELKDIVSSQNSLTGAYLRGDKKIPLPDNRRKLTGNYLEIRGASEHNLKNLNIKFPLNMFITVTGVSGSGKSTLVNDVLFKGLAREIGKSWEKPGKFKSIEGKENVDKIIDIDQSPIGRTPRSNPATYTKSFDLIRELFASTNESKLRGYKPGRFSFNVSQNSGGGRCEKCNGDGVLKIEMHFLPDVFIPCDVCKGARYNRETLEVRYKGKSIAEVLDMTVDEATDFFKNIPNLDDKMRVLQDVGLGYIKLGQPATTLSGGEAQRIKLSTELSKRSTGKTLYILDEPTTGLHFEDVNKLLLVLNRLVDQGNTVVVIEHNLDVIKTADYIIDLGPEGGDLGGKVIAAGTPEMIAGIKVSSTGHFLQRVLHDGD